MKTINFNKKELTHILNNLSKNKLHCVRNTLSNPDSTELTEYLIENNLSTKYVIVSFKSEQGSVESIGLSKYEDGIIVSLESEEFLEKRDDEELYCLSKKIKDINDLTMQVDFFINLFKKD